MNIQDILKIYSRAEQTNKMVFDNYDVSNDSYRWNSVNSDWINSNNAINEIGCIHTVQGYDLNYTGVIIGPELIYRDHQVKVDIAKYKD